MLVKRQTAKGSAVSVVVALTLSSACSLQDFEYLGAGEPTETSDDETTEGSDDTTTLGPGPLDGGTDSGDADVDGAPPPEGGADTDGPVSTDTTTDDPTSDTSSTDTVTTDQTTEPPDAGPTLPVVVDPNNLVQNASFESGLGSWTPQGTPKLSSSPVAARSGELGVLITNRTQEWEGPSLNIVNLVEPGEVYRFSGWVRLAVAPEDGLDQRMGATLKYVCRNDAGVIGDEVYEPIISTHTQTAWSNIDGVYTIPNCEILILVLYFEGPPPGADFYLDDVSIVPN